MPTERHSLHTFVGYAQPSARSDLQGRDAHLELISQKEGTPDFKEEGRILYKFHVNVGRSKRLKRAQEAVERVQWAAKRAQEARKESQEAPRKDQEAP